MNAIIQDIMRPFGVTPRYAGFPMLVASSSTWKTPTDSPP